MQKIQNGKWTDPNLMDQEYLETIKEKSIRIGRILNANYQNSESEQKVNRSIHLTKFQRVILICCLERYGDLLDGNLGERTGPAVNISLKDKANTYHAQDLPITVIHLETFKKYLDRLVAIGVLTKWTAVQEDICKPGGRIAYERNSRISCPLSLYQIPCWNYHMQNQ